MKKLDEHVFHSLPGVKAKRVKGVMAKSVNGFFVALRKYRAVSDAGDYGSVIVYRSDDRLYHCHFMRWQQSIDEQEYATQAQVRAWLKEWLPVQRQQPAA
jgi:hypothetical protein